MADRSHPHQLQVHPQQRYEGGFKNLLPQKGPSASQVIAVITLLPVGGTLLTLAGITLTLTLIGCAVTTPIFFICSPVLVPAAIVLGLAVTAFLASGALGLTALSSLTWVFNYLRGAASTMPEQMDHAKRRMQEKAKDLGQGIQNKAQEGGRT
ncbi:hypothetical protein L1049_003009 [Liquidambar formosana]|uniref:Oleosin n=1 Tax=Liquidambar formosana TaxID=63359 RepID=A0AAP0NH53_LIQFO